jgi:hypothetical protein
MARRSVVFDLVIAAAVVVAGQLEAWHGTGATLRQGPHWAEAALYALTGAAVAARRLDPLRCLAVIVAVSVAEFLAFGAPEGNGILWPGLIAGYSVARWETRRPPWWGLVLLAVLGLAWDLRIEPDTGTLHTRVAALSWLSLWLIAWLVGGSSAASCRISTSGAARPPSAPRRRWPRSATGSRASCTTSSATASAS